MVTKRKVSSASLHSKSLTRKSVCFLLLHVTTVMAIKATQELV